ncbi:MAG: hypothetical protein V5A43_10630 [Haloarculaceae archaeon]
MGLLTDTKINSNLTTVPEAVRNYLTLESGDRIEWYVEDANVVVRRKGGRPGSADAQSATEKPGEEPASREGS